MITRVGLKIKIDLLNNTNIISHYNLKLPTQRIIYCIYNNI